MSSAYFKIFTFATEDLIVSVYSENKSGLSTLPWGVPMLVVADNDRLVPHLVYWCSV